MPLGVVRGGSAASVGLSVHERRDHSDGDTRWFSRRSDSSPSPSFAVVHRRLFRIKPLTQILHRSRSSARTPIRRPTRSASRLTRFPRTSLGFVRSSARRQTGSWSSSQSEGTRGKSRRCCGCCRTLRTRSARKSRRNTTRLAQTFQVRLLRIPSSSLGTCTDAAEPAGHPPPAYIESQLSTFLALLSRYASSTLRVGIKLPPYTFQEQYDALLRCLVKVGASRKGDEHPISFLTSTNTLGQGALECPHPCLHD